MPGRTELAEAVARNLFKLMAIKDEYEVARLWTDGSFLRQLGASSSAGTALEVHLAPPAPGRARSRHRPPQEAPLRPLDAARVAPAGPPEAPARHRLRPVRPHRRAPHGAPAARRLRDAARRAHAEGSIADNHATGGRARSLPQQIRGFGHVKEASLQRPRPARPRCWSRWRGEQPACRRRNRPRIALQGRLGPYGRREQDAAGADHQGPGGPAGNTPAVQLGLPCSAHVERRARGVSHR